MTRRKIVLAMGLAVIAAAGAYLAWHIASGPAVATHIVARGELRQSVVATGRVESPRRVEIGSAITGTVAQVAVEEGDSVRAGQLLVRLDDAEARAAVDQARSSVAQAEARIAQLQATAMPVATEALRQAQVTLANAERSLSRARDLHGRGFVGEAALDEAQRVRDLAASQVASATLQERSQSPGGSEARLAGAALEAAQAGLRTALAKLENTTLEAPAAGVLIARTVERGSVVQPGRALLVLSPHGNTQLVVQLDERNLALVALGQSALVSADAYPEVRFDAKVASINPAVDAVRGSVEVKLDVPRPPPYLLQDMTVSVDILAATRSDVLAIPADALHPGDWVYTVRKGRLAKQAIKPGARGAGTVEVLEGLREGDVVVTGNRPAADDGKRVRVAAGP